MEVSITGTGSIWSICNSAAAVINKSIAVDFPNGNYKALIRQGIDPGDIGHILITHMHGDHILDLPVWALRKVKFGYPEENPKIYASESMVGFLKILIHESFPESLSGDVLSAYFDFITEDEFEIDDILVKRVPVSHGIQEAYGYMMTDGRHTVSFSGDSCLCEGIRRMAAGSDIFICETAKLKATDMHLGVQAVIDLAEEYTNCRIITTHMNDEVREAFYQRSLPGNLTVGNDGLTIDINAGKAMLQTASGPMNEGAHPRM